MTTPAILAALRAVLPYAEAEAGYTRRLANANPDLADVADAATHAITAARLALADADAQTYTLAEVRNGTGWPKGVRFVALA